MAYLHSEITIHWNETKNEWLKQTRGISFEEIVARLTSVDLLDVIDHPNTNRYPGQKVFIVRVDEHVVSVPFVERERMVFLKTIIPSRKMRKKYSEKEPDEA